MKICQLDTPSLLIDREIMNSNLSAMQSYANMQHVALRPHTKTHKMPYIAKRAVELGACGIAVAKTGEAEVMAGSGLRDIFIANEVVGPSKLSRIAALAERISISFGVDSAYHVEEAEKAFSAAGLTAEVLIEVEVGEVRCGIDSMDELFPLLDVLKKCPHVHLKGFFGHDGNTYSAESMEKCREISRAAQEKLVAFSDAAKAYGMTNTVVSYGSTPPLVNHFDIIPGITEIRPGTYALMDGSQGNAIGTLEHCAATVLASVISRPAPDRVILDVGAKGLTQQERTAGICNSGGKGRILGYTGVTIGRIFDEHVIIHDQAFRDKVHVGQKLRIIPVHICPVCNLYDTAALISGDEVVDTLTVAGRGKLQ